MSGELLHSHHLPAGTILKERFRIEGILGEGGFGITYRGLDITLEMPVAVKEFYPHGYAVRNVKESLDITLVSGADLFDTWRERFLQEARTLAKCADVPQIVQVRDFFEEHNTAYIVMEYLSGETLRDYIQKNGVMSASSLYTSMIPLVRALDQVHQHGLIHRDISPDNIMLMADGSLKLFDFGAARSYSDSEHRTLSIMLKPGFAPEEQYRTKGEQGPWTDVYALCATMYKCLTGVTPPDALERLHEDTLRLPSQTGAEITQAQEQVLIRGMSIRGSDRYPDAASLADAMEAAEGRSERSQDVHTSQVTVMEPDIPRTQPDPSKAAKEKDKQPSESENQHSKQEQEQKTVPGKQKIKKSWIWIAAGILVVLAVAAVILLKPADTVEKKEPPEETTSAAPIETVTREATEPVSEDLPVVTESEEETDASKQAYPDVEIPGKTLESSALWGVQVNTSDDFLKGMQFMDVQTSQGTLNLSAVPLALISGPIWGDTQQGMLLCFADQFGYLYFVYGAYEIREEGPQRQKVLALSPGEEKAPSFSDYFESLKLSVNLTDYIWEEGTAIPEGENAYMLAADLKFNLNFTQSNGSSGFLQLEKSGLSRKYRSGFLYAGERGQSPRSFYMSGRASDPDHLYKGMESLELIYNMDTTKTMKGILQTDDGGVSKDAKVTDFWDSLLALTIKTSLFTRLYNGRVETFDESREYHSVYIINNYPFGFIIYEEGELYYYQNAVLSAEE